MLFTVNDYKATVTAIIEERIEEVGALFMPDWLKLTVFRWFLDVVTSAAMPFSLCQVARSLRIEFTITKDGMTYRRAEPSWGGGGVSRDMMKEQRQLQFREARSRAPESKRHLIVPSFNTPRIASLLRILEVFPEVVIRINRYGFVLDNLTQYPVLETRRCTQCKQELTVDCFPPIPQKRGRPERKCKTCLLGPPPIKRCRRRAAP